MKHDLDRILIYKFSGFIALLENYIMKDTKKINTFPGNPRPRINLNAHWCLTPVCTEQCTGALALHPLHAAAVHVEHVVAVTADLPPRTCRVEFELLLRQFLLTIPAGHTR